MCPLGPATFSIRRNRKTQTKPILIEDLQKVLMGIDENLAGRERRIFRDLAFGEFFNLEGQHVRDLQSFPG